MKPKTIASQLGVARALHTWTISALYFLTFGCFVAMGASLPLIIQSVFADAPGGAPSPLLYAPFAPLVATLAVGTAAPAAAQVPGVPQAREGGSC